MEYCFVEQRCFFDLCFTVPSLLQWILFEQNKGTYSSKSCIPKYRESSLASTGLNSVNRVFLCTIRSSWQSHTYVVDWPVDSILHGRQNSFSSRTCRMWKSQSFRSCNFLAFKEWKSHKIQKNHQRYLPMTSKYNKLLPSYYWRTKGINRHFVNISVFRELKIIKMTINRQNNDKSSK